MEYFPYSLFSQYAIQPSRARRKSHNCSYIYRDELNKRTAPLKVKRKVDFESEPLIQREICEKSIGVGNAKNVVSKDPIVNLEKAGMRVKILMTKEDATRLLSKCGDGGVLEFKDVADELARIQNNRTDLRLATKKNE